MDTTLLNALPLAAGNRLAGLNSFAGQVMVTGVVVTLIALVAGAAMWTASHFSRSARAKIESFTFVPLVLIGAAAIGSVTALVGWGATGIGTTGLMPAQAREANVEITKKAPKTTCDNEHELVVEDLWGDHGLNDEAKNELGKVVNADEVGPQLNLQAKGATVHYKPKGPDCSKENTTPDPCQPVKIKMDFPPHGDQKAPDVDKEFAPKNKAQCSR